MGRVAERWRYLDGGGEIGLISSVTQAFCGGCAGAPVARRQAVPVPVRARRPRPARALRDGASDDELAAIIAGIWTARGDNYSELRGRNMADPSRKIEMSYIGG